MADLIIKALGAYLLGSVLGSLVVGRLRGGVDIRTQGSGNAGGTNALRTQGKSFALWVMLIDVGKGVLAAGVLPLLPLAQLWDGAAYPDSLVALVCGGLAVAGHVFPVFYSFRGGKGAATLLGVLAVVAPWLLIPVLAGFVIVLVLTGYVGLSTILASAAAALSVAVWVPQGVTTPLFWFAVVMSLFILYTHRSNLQRLLAGTENRFDKAMLFHKRRD